MNTPSTKPLRDQIISRIESHSVYLPVRLPAHDIITLSGQDAIAGIPFDTVLRDDESGKICLVNDCRTYAVELGGLPASTLLRILRALAAKNREALREDLLDRNTSRNLLLTNTGLYLDTQAFLDAHTVASAACTHIFECLLQLGGPLEPDDLLDDGCGQISPDASESTLPYVTVADSFLGNTVDELHNIEEIEWINEDNSLLAILKTQQEEEFFFTVSNGSIRPTTKQEGSVLNPAGLNLPFESVLSLEEQVNTALNRQIAVMKAESLTTREYPVPGTLYAIAIKELIRTKNNGRSTILFNRKSFDYQADAPHIHTPFGYAEIQAVSLHNGQLYSYTNLCNHPMQKVFDGSEQEDWPKIFSHAYTQCRQEGDPDCEQWLQAFSNRLPVAFH